MRKAMAWGIQAGLLGLLAAAAMGVLLGLLPAPAAGQQAAQDATPATAGDATLKRLVFEALAANPDLAAARSRVEAARAERFHAALALAPAVTASSGYTRQRMAGAAFPVPGDRLPDQSLWEAGLRLSWEVDVFGRGRRALEARGALADAAEKDVDDAAVLLSSAVAGAYYHLLGEEDRLAVARRNASNQEATLQLTRDRLDAGRGTALDTERAQAQLSSTLAAIPTLEASVTAARNRLAVLLGRAPGDFTETVGPSGPLPDPAVAFATSAPGAFGDLRDLRPDVRGAERRVDAASAGVSAARSGYLPRISLVGAAGYTAGALGDLGASGTPRYAVGPVLSWPLLDLGRVKADVDHARATRREAVARFEGTVLRAQEEMETTAVAYSAALDRLRHLEDAAQASERAAELVRLRFVEGATDFLEVLDAERRLLEAQDRLAAGRAEAADALVAGKRARGGFVGEGR